MPPSPIPSPVPSPAPGAGAVVQLAGDMLPTTIFTLLLIAMMIDWMGIGPDGIRDRAAFLLGTAAIRAGWDGSPADKHTVDAIARFVDEAKGTGNTGLAQASTGTLVGVVVGIVGVYCIGCLIPDTWATRAGRWARLSFSSKGPAGPAAAGPGAGRTKRRLNGKVWALAWLIGVTAEMPGGLVGAVIGGGVDILGGLVGWLPDLLFGVVT